MIARNSRTPGRPGDDAAPKSKPTRSKCPICQKLVEVNSEFFPFCSQQCRQIDLGKWLSGDYKISRPLDPIDEEQD